MQLAPLIQTSIAWPAQAVTPTPSPTPALPTRWARWWKTPIAAIDYAAGSRIAPWREAWLPTERTITGNRTPSMTFGGTSIASAIEAAHAVARVPVHARVSDIDGRLRNVRLNPAMAVMHDAKTGAYWITPLTASVLSGDTWIETRHSIDGVAFEGSHPWLRMPRVASAARDLVAVVGRDHVITPEAWHDAPDTAANHTTDA